MTGIFLGVGDKDAQIAVIFGLFIVEAVTYIIIRPLKVCWAGGGEGNRLFFAHWLTNATAGSVEEPGDDLHHAASAGSAAGCCNEHCRQDIG